MKKKLYFILTVAIGSMFVSSCKKYIDLKPEDFITKANYYQNEAQLDAGVLSIYDVFANYQGFLYGDNMCHILQAGNDEMYGMFAQDGTYRYLSSYRNAPNDDKTTPYWSEFYRAINYANVILEAVDAPNAAGVAPVAKNKIKGQALFLRGFCYFMLVSRFGGVPLTTKSTASVSDIARPRATEAEVYAQVVSDMETAEGLLPTASEWGAGVGVSRVSKNTCQGMLARVNLYWAGWPSNNVSRYAEARKWALKVIETAQNGLNPNYSDIWCKIARDEYDAKESMWEIDFKGNAQTVTPTEYGLVGDRNGPSNQSQTVLGASQTMVKPTGQLFNLFPQDATTGLCNDLRRDRNITPFGFVQAATNVIWERGYFSPTQIWERWIGKWRREEDPLLPRQVHANGLNFPVLRYSDVLLMFAEADNYVNNGPTAAGYDAINQVRRRSYGTGYKVVGLTITNPGSGYTKIPYVNIAPSGSASDPNGVARAYATGTITGTAGSPLTTVRMISQGAFYSATPPVVTITSFNGVGSGATAVAIMSPVPIDPSQYNLPSGLNKDQFLAAIQDERSRELCFEALRSADLRRWNILIPRVMSMRDDANANCPVNGGPNNQETGSSYNNAGLKGFAVEAGNNIATRHLYWPIPASEMQLNKAMVQNPGW
jgi:hypothetical protein